MYTDEEGEQMTPQAGFRLKIAKTGSEAAIVASFNESTDSMWKPRSPR